jgi:hypothetical protein
VFGKLNNCIFSALTSLLILQLILLTNCTAPLAPPEKAMYYWRSSFQPGSKEMEFLRHANIRTLYVRYFDVVIDPAVYRPTPVASLSDPARQLAGYNIIPVVFITQEALQSMADSSTDHYAGLICNRIENMNSQFGLATTKEWQIDCDWTLKTKEKYFKLLRAVKSITGKNKILLSVTLRLYPYKYRSKMGIPPADKALLMCYNMGNLRNPNTVNSIIDPEEMSKYLSVNQAYPMPLDAALPLFSWYVWYRDREYKGLVYPTELEHLSGLTRKDNRLYFTKDTLWNGRLFLAGDWLREEITTIKALHKAKHLINHQLGGQPINRLALFHLDSLILKKYAPDALEEILGSDR